MRIVHKITINGFKSIAHATVELGDINVLIGANGSGKTNLIGAFRLLERVHSQKLQMYVGSDPDRVLHHGRKKTPELNLTLELEQGIYGLTLTAQENRLLIGAEDANNKQQEGFSSSGYGRAESRLEQEAEYSAKKLQQLGIDPEPSDDWMPNLFSTLRSSFVYDFQDSSDSSPAKQTCRIDDNRALRPNAENLAAYLYLLQQKHPVNFRHIEEHIRLVAPFFDRFLLAPLAQNERSIKLEWAHKNSDAYFDAYSFSDGTLRFICLATLLLQPEPPALILLDEPELGLHPFALKILAEMIEAAASKSQIILATQSVTLLNNFSLKDVVVVEHDNTKSSFKRLDETALTHWLEEFNLGELWESNVLGGRP